MRRQRYNHTLSAPDDTVLAGQEDVSNPDGLDLPINQEQNWQPFNFEFLNSIGSSSYYTTDTNSFHTLNSYQLNNNNRYNGVGEQYQDVSDAYQSFMDTWYSNYLNGYQLEYNPQQRVPDSQPTESDIIGNGEQIYDEDCPYQRLIQEVPTTYPAVSPFGTVYLLLRHWLRVDITPDKAIYVTNHPGRCVAAINGVGDQSCIIHPNGKVLQDGVTINMETGDRTAKISRRGVIFTSNKHSLSYLVDASGTKSTSEKFADMTRDFSLGLFFSKAVSQDPQYDCYSAIANASYRSFNNGDEVWIVAGVRIKQDQWGEVRITRSYGRRAIRTSPTIGGISVITPYIFMNISSDPSRYFLVRRGEKRVSCNACGMTVRNGSQLAGFNKAGRLVLY